MDYVPKPNTGSLFNVKEKRNSNWPDIRGDIFISRELLENVLQQDGDLVKISLSAWRKESKTGTKYLSLSVSEPYEKKTEERKQEPQDDEDVPF
jgi:hypothetical protein